MTPLTRQSPPRPERFAIEHDERFDVFYVYRNTGAGWIFVADYDTRGRAEQRVEEWEDEMDEMEDDHD